MRVRGTTGKLKAFFTAMIDDLEVDDFRLIVGVNGPFIGTPSKKIVKDGNDEWINTVRFARDENGKNTPRGQELHDTLLKAAIAEYERRTTETIEWSGSSEGDDLPF
jgi:DNA-binding cell septation regulator SpoVG